MTVEECSRLSITDLRRAGFFRGSFGTWGSCRWSDSNRNKIRAVVFRLLSDASARLILEVRQDVGISLPTLQNSAQRIIPITVTKCNFGGQRFWFCCPKVTKGLSCGRRVAVLYSLPGGEIFACRGCLDLSYRSVQEHDARIDRLLRLPHEQFFGIFETGSPSERSLASRALPRLRNKLQKQLTKLSKPKTSGASFGTLGLPREPGFLNSFS
jgi:hypothetical protein